jgi:hypothetical protein
MATNSDCLTEGGRHGDVELYRQLLRLGAPWTLTRVELDVKTRVDI